MRARPRAARRGRYLTTFLVRIGLYYGGRAAAPLPTAELIFVFFVGDMSPSSMRVLRAEPPIRRNPRRRRRRGDGRHEDFGVAPTVSPSSTCARRSGPPTSLLRRADCRVAPPPHPKVK